MITTVPDLAGFKLMPRLVQWSEETQRGTARERELQRNDLNNDLCVYQHKVVYRHQDIK